MGLIDHDDLALVCQVQDCFDGVLGLIATQAIRIGRLRPVLLTTRITLMSLVKGGERLAVASERVRTVSWDDPFAPRRRVFLAAPPIIPQEPEQ